MRCGVRGSEWSADVTGLYTNSMPVRTSNRLDVLTGIELVYKPVTAKDCEHNRNKLQLEPHAQRPLKVASVQVKVYLAALVMALTGLDALASPTR